MLMGAKSPWNTLVKLAKFKQNQDMTAMFDTLAATFAKEQDRVSSKTF